MLVVVLKIFGWDLDGRWAKYDQVVCFPCEIGSSWDIAGIGLKGSEGHTVQFLMERMVEWYLILLIWRGEKCGNVIEVSCASKVNDFVAELVVYR